MKPIQVKGVKVEIAIPTTLNSVHALIVRSADSVIAVSNRGVDEILFAGAGEIIFEDNLVLSRVFKT